MYDIDDQRWRRRGSGDKRIQAIQRELDMWGAMLNFLYCSGYTIIVVTLVAYWIVGDVNHFSAMLGLGLMLSVCGMVTDIRATLRELRIIDDYPQ
jgi:hypothetical protein